MRFRYIMLLSTLIVISNVMGQQYETQQYSVIEAIEGFEVRYYPPVMKIQSDNNFNALFGYISGNNEGKTKIAMTTPVYMKNFKGQDIMEFVLPQSFNSKNAPKPESSGVRLHESKAGYFLAIRFGGYARERSKRIQTEKLIALAARHQLKTIGKPLLLVYHSPFRFLRRKNEMLFEIDYKKSLERETDFKHDLNSKKH